MKISTSDAQGIITKMLIAAYKERVAVTSFFRSFFANVETSTLAVSIEVQRGFEKIAVDVERGSDGNRNQFTKSTEKIIIPPYFREYFDITNLQLYDKLFAATEVDSVIFAEFINDLAEKLQMLKDKIERTYEKYCADVLLLGSVTLKDGTSINFNRKAESLVNESSFYFAANNDYTLPFIAAGTFIRQVGKSNGGTLNAILGGLVMADLLQNTKFKERNDLVNMKLDSVAPPQRDATGGVLHGRITAGAWNVNLWTYPEFYDNAAGTSTPYMDEKKVIVLPERPNFKMAFAAVPQLITPGQPPVKGAFVYSDYPEPKKKTHEYHVESAGVPVPVAVDQIYTFRGKAA